MSIIFLIQKHEIQLLTGTEKKKKIKKILKEKKVIEGHV